MNNHVVSYDKITHQKRLHVLHRGVTLKQDGKKIAAGLGLKYNSVRNIIFTYLRTGRTNKMMNTLPKKIHKM